MTRARTPSRSGVRIGYWRLLAPALLCWGCSAALVHVEGAARWAAAAMGIAAVGACAWMLRVPAARRVAATCVLWCALILMLCVRIDAGERVRSDRGLRIEATLAASEPVVAELKGFPAVTTGLDGTDRGWVRAMIDRVPVMLWLPEVADERWGPSTLVEITGQATRASPESLAAYEVRVQTMRGVDKPGEPLRRLLSEMPAALRTTLTRAAGDQAGAELVPGFSVGDTSLVSEDLNTLMKETSLTHLVAVSGANCALLTGAAMWAAAHCGVGRRGRQAVAGCVLASFVIVVGPDPSVQRAAIMATVVLMSNFGGRQARSLPALGVAVYVLLVSNPWQALAPGFALSVVATGGILLFASPVETWLRVRLRLPRFLAVSVGIACVAQIACAPLLLLLQPGLPVAGIFANVLAAPAAPAGTALGLVAMLLLQVHPVFGARIVWLASWPARWVVASGEFAAALPGGRAFWPGGWNGALLLATVIALLLCAWAVSSDRFGVPGPSGEQRPGFVPWASRVRLPRRQRICVQVLIGLSVGALVGVVVVVPVAVRVGVPNDWMFAACDVGQGDALLLRDPGEPSEVVLIDVGDDPDALGECLDTLGVRRIALLVLTHDHRDHVGAVARVLPITDAAMVAPATTAQASNRPIVATIAGAGVPVVIGDVGMSSRNGAGMAAGADVEMAAGSGIVWEVLSPRASATFTDVNATSLVVNAAVGDATILLLGDTGEPEQRALLAQYPQLRADIVKVAHHGSRDQFAELYRQLRSQVALVSVGEHNRYGHPNTELLQSLLESGATPLRTDQLGTIALSVRDGRIEVWADGRPVGYHSTGVSGTR